MPSNKAVSVVACAVMFAVGSHTRADIVWSEGVNGDLSGDHLNPTALTVAVGSNTLLGSVTRDERDYVTFTVPVGATLDQIILTDYVSLSAIAFIGMQAGPIISDPPTMPVVGNLLGYTHFGPAENIGADILPDIGIGAGAIGFTPPLPAGQYSLWIQETSLNVTQYGFDLVIVPAPGAAMLVLPALAGLAVSRRRRD